MWGEGALDPGAANDAETVADVEAAIAAVGSPTLVGAVLNDPDGTQRTSVVLLNGAGDPVDRYDKVHLVPFGEYVPWRDELSWISAIRAGADRPDAGGAGAHRIHRGAAAVRHADLLREQLPFLDAGVRPRRGRVPGGAGEQRVVRDDGGVRAAPADEPDARGGERPVGGERRRLRHQRVHRSQRPRGGGRGLVPNRDPAPHDPFVRRRHAVRPAGGIGSRGSPS